MLKTVLLSVWDPQINNLKAAFDLLLGRLSVDIGPSTPTPSSASSSKLRLNSKQPPKVPSTTVVYTHLANNHFGITDWFNCYEPLSHL